MGTWVVIEAVAENEPKALGGIEAAFAAVLAVERRMHPTRVGSDVQRINAAHPGTPVAIHSSTWRVLELARRVHALSDGVFDPCLPTHPGRFEDLELCMPSAQHSPWVIGHAPLALDLGGIAKGYAIDCAVDALINAGCDAGLVNAGGDLRRFGGQRATILLRHAGNTYEPMAVGNIALAVSDLDAPQRPPEHRGYYIRADTTGQGNRRYAAVQAAEAAIADALTKCALLCSREAAARVLRGLGGREAA